MLSSQQALTEHNTIATFQSEMNSILADLKWSYFSKQGKISFCEVLDSTLGMREFVYGLVKSRLLKLSSRSGPDFRSTFVKKVDFTRL